MSELETGKIISHYRIENLIGAGGMGTVYKAFDLNLERHVALKLMHPQIASVREFRERLKAEARAAANLDHPSIVQIYNFNETEDGNLYVAMEYLRDGSLRSHLQRTRSRGAFLDISLALQIAIEIAEALDHAHAHGNGVIHRDVKPGNIILKRLEQSERAGFAPFRAVLTDFGLVQVINSARVTNAGITMGTPLYMSPEQCEGLNLDRRSDLYSLGVVFYEMLAGRPPFNFSSLSQAIAAHIHDRQPAPIREYRPDVPPLLDALVARAMEKKPEDRFQSGRAMADALRTAYFSISDTPTRQWHNIQFEETGSLALSPPEVQTELVIRSLDVVGEAHTTDRYPLTEALYKIGRKDDNNIVLGDDAVSRHHAQLEHTPAGWVIRARSSVNGTFLNGRRLRPDEPMILRTGEPVRMGPYELWINTPNAPVSEPRIGEAVTFQPDDIEEPLTQAFVREAQREQLPVPVSQTEPPLGVFLDRDSFEVLPGQAVEIIAEVVNRSRHSDRVRLDVQGLPQSWLELPRFTTIEPDERVEIPFLVRPPRSAESEAGIYNVDISLISQRSSDIDVVVPTSLTVQAFESFETKLSPRNFSLPETLNVDILNKGNAAATYSVTARESDGLIGFNGERGRVRVEPNQTVTVQLEAESEGIGFLRGAADIPFEVDIRAESGGLQTLHGVARQRRGAAVWAIPASLMLLAISLLFFCGQLTERLVPALLTNRQPEPTATIFAAADPLQPTTALGGVTTEATVPITPTSTLVSGDPNDPDGDGLSNTQEGLLGTNPNVPDSDGDGLSDGEELNVTATEPTKADTDGDGINDGDEVRTHRTMPNKFDTDGDGISDGLELANGTNPLVSDIAAPTSLPEQPTMILPTNTAIVITPTPQPATNTPIVVVASSTPTPIVVTATPDPVTNTPIVVTATPQQVTPTPIIATPTNTPIIVIATDTPPPTSYPVPSETPFLTVVPPETKTPTPEPPTATPEPATATPELATPTQQSVTPTATNVPLPTTPPLPTQSLTCASLPPTIDGTISGGEWESGAMIGSMIVSTFAADVMAVTDGNALYVAFDIADDTIDGTDSVRLYLDVNGNGGDPDSADRQFLVGRDGAAQLSLGSGSNNDGNTWTLVNLSPDWTVFINEISGGWVVEMQIPLDLLLPDLGNQFGLMSETLFTSAGLVRYPENADAGVVSTWRLLDNGGSCP